MLCVVLYVIVSWGENNNVCFIFVCSLYLYQSHHVELRDWRGPIGTLLSRKSLRSPGSPLVALLGGLSSCTSVCFSWTKPHSTLQRCRIRHLRHKLLPHIHYGEVSYPGPNGLRKTSDTVRWCGCGSPCFNIFNRERKWEQLPRISSAFRSVWVQTAWWPVPPLVQEVVIRQWKRNTCGWEWVILRRFELYSRLKGTTGSRCIYWQGNWRNWGHSFSSIWEEFRRISLPAGLFRRGSG